MTESPKQMSRAMISIVMLFFTGSTATAHANDVDKWTDLGYVVISTLDGRFVSRHVEREQAVTSATRHAYENGNTGNLSYRLVYPNAPFELLAPAVATLEPPSASPPSRDTGEILDPKTIYFCPADSSGAQGTTVEPPGSANNDGTSPWDAYADLDQLGIRPDGTDVRLCEGGIFEDQSLAIHHGGDIGDKNRIILSQFSDDRQIGADQLLSVGFSPEEINPVVVGCYKILNGVPRPCMNTYPRCNTGISTECYDAEFQKVVPLSRSIF